MVLVASAPASRSRCPQPGSRHHHSLSVSASAAGLACSGRQRRSSGLAMTKVMSFDLEYRQGSQTDWTRRRGSPSRTIPPSGGQARGQVVHHHRAMPERWAPRCAEFGSRDQYDVTPPSAGAGSYRSVTAMCWGETAPCSGSACRCAQLGKRTRGGHQHARTQVPVAVVGHVSNEALSPKPWPTQWTRSAPLCAFTVAMAAGTS